MSTNPYSSPQADGQPPELRKRRFVPTLVEVLIVVAVIGIVLAFFLPARRGVSGAARRTQCVNNLRQIALALENYQAVHGSLPPAYTVDAEGKPLHSWRTLILPFMEQHALYEKIDLSKPWDDPANTEVFETVLYTYQCPSATSPPGYTTYVAVAAPGGCFDLTQPRKLSDITDDHDLTLMVMELPSDHAVHWMSPNDASETLLRAPGNADKLPHPQGAHAVCVSGRVLSLDADISPTRLRALVSIAGGDDARARAPTE
jgi:type II secretory pathway pseudopilin PulG